ncbi:rho guanine nucleotide exchange factor 28-like isoform x14 [Plakobranchus ocellatus]|uniref:Rho guanine nucleotide exchange factor 28-like isoform x14 n=1 Tax=Plakobranchus ocellatus TaxID=259542 RepID=A0AAV4AZH9_9GAST|nr:rho guanine nucleotide exchange factor 28-like isoform x14 [Plakobranchus ocellatus]
MWVAIRAVTCNKEKESKSKHRFVAISFSNATACDVCHKPMANKAALRCENCLVNVHEHNCKDQVPQCDKNRTKSCACHIRNDADVYLDEYDYIIMFQPLAVLCFSG